MGAVVRVRARAPAEARAGRRCSRSLYPVTTVTAIVVTANHYFLDAVGGFFVLGVGYVLARIFTRAGRGRPRPRVADGPTPDGQSLRVARWPRTRKPDREARAAAEIAITRIIGALDGVEEPVDAHLVRVQQREHHEHRASERRTTISLTLTLRPSSCDGFVCHRPHPRFVARPYLLRAAARATRTCFSHQAAHAVAHRLVGERQLHVARVDHREPTRWQVRRS